jgi:hypothetical protein
VRLPEEERDRDDALRGAKKSVEEGDGERIGEEEVEEGEFGMKGEGEMDKGGGIGRKSDWGVRIDATFSPPLVGESSVLRDDILGDLAGMRVIGGGGEFVTSSLYTFAFSVKFFPWTCGTTAGFEDRSKKENGVWRPEVYNTGLLNKILSEIKLKILSMSKLRLAFVNSSSKYILGIIIYSSSLTVQSPINISRASVNIMLPM